jgi:hypothetical protein
MLVAGDRLVARQKQKLAPRLELTARVTYPLVIAGMVFLYGAKYTHWLA